MARKLLLSLVTVVGLGIVSAQVNAQTTTVRIPTLAAGTTSIINTVISEKGFDKKNGLKIEYSVRTSISAYYADYRIGHFDAIVGGVGNAMKDRAKGLDSTIFATQSPTASFFLAKDPSLKGYGALRGKKIAAPLGSGNYLVARAAAGLYGIDLAKDAEVVNVRGPASGPTQLAAGRVDVAFSWEPAVSIFLSKNPDMRIVVNVREAYRKKTGKDSHVIVLYAHEAFLKKNPKVVSAMIKTYQQAGAYVKNNLDDALKIIQRKTGKGTGPIRDAFVSGRVSYATKPASEERDMLMTLMQAIVKTGLVKEIPPGVIYSQ